MNTLILYKKLGETPLECVNRFKLENKAYKSIPITYAGRLDPMAEGLLLCLTGKECKNKEKYLALNKEYIFEILIGFSTDTHDLLGLIQNCITKKEINDDSATSNVSKLFDIMPSFIGKRLQTYPAYSSKTINGKALHALSRKGNLIENDLPSREVEIFSLEKLEERKIERSKLLTEIITKINLVKGDFRQKEIEEAWNKYLGNSNNIDEFCLVKIKMFCSSGTYVRALVRDISNATKIPMCVYSIVRTKISEASPRRGLRP